MSGEKTEQPTPKKLRDAAKKGQTFKTRDLIVALMLFCCSAYLLQRTRFNAISDIYRRIIELNFNLSLHDLMVMLGWAFLQLVIPIVLLCTVVSALPSLLLSKFSLASEAVKIDFAKLNPVEGVKKLFSMRTIKELVKALLYLLLFSVALWLLWEKNKNTIFGQLHGNVSSLATVMMELFFSFVALSLLCCLPIFLLDSLAEYYFHMKNLKMDKNEVKREYKEQEGNPEIKQHRRQSHMELLSEQIKFDIKQSSFVLANPTHIAIGVYFNPGISPVPLVSVLETNHRARAVIAYARQCGIPVVRDIPLARGLFKFVHRYSMIPLSHVDGIFRILTWLLEVETNAMHSADSTGISSSDPSRTPP